MNKRLMIFMGIVSLIFVNTANAAGSRRVVTDDATGFNSTLVRAASGIQWSVARPYDVNLGSGGVQTGAWAGTAFALRGGSTIISSGLLNALAIEDGTMFLGGAEQTPTVTPNFISVFRGADLTAGDPYSYRESVGVPEGPLVGGYRLGELSVANANRLLPAANGAGFDPNANDPNGFGALRRITWFGLTDGVDNCNAAQLDFANGNIAGTVCADYETRARYFGQIELHDVGTKEDGDFNLFLGLGYGGLIYAPDGTQVANYGNTNQYPSTATGGGFRIGNQQYLFSAAEARSGEIFTEFRFRNSLACAVQSDGSCSGDFTVNENGGGNGNGNVPTPGAAVLVLLGIAVMVNRSKRHSKRTAILHC
jgi:hypothetical protein